MTEALNAPMGVPAPGRFFTRAGGLASKVSRVFGTNVEDKSDKRKQEDSALLKSASQFRNMVTIMKLNQTELEKMSRTNKALIPSLKALQGGQIAAVSAIASRVMENESVRTKDSSQLINTLEMISRSMVGVHDVLQFDLTQISKDQISMLKDSRVDARDKRKTLSDLQKSMSRYTESSEALKELKSIDAKSLTFQKDEVDWVEYLAEEAMKNRKAQVRTQMSLDDLNDSFSSTSMSLKEMGKMRGGGLFARNMAGRAAATGKGVISGFIAQAMAGMGLGDLDRALGISDWVGGASGGAIGGKVFGKMTGGIFGGMGTGGIAGSAGGLGGLSAGITGLAGSLGILGAAVAGTYLAIKGIDWLAENTEAGKKFAKIGAGSAEKAFEAKAVSDPEFAARYSSMSIEEQAQEWDKFRTDFGSQSTKGSPFLVSPTTVPGQITPNQVSGISQGTMEKMLPSTAPNTQGTAKPASDVPTQITIHQPSLQPPSSKDAHVDDMRLAYLQSLLF
jgi:hypothetical protein